MSVSRTAWYKSQGPNGKEIVSRDARGGGQYPEEYESVSPSPYVMLPQITLEPILQKKALELKREGICYNSEVIDVEEQEDGVVLTVRRKDGS